MVFNTYHHTRTCLDEKIEIDEKNFKFFFRYQFQQKKHFFVFCQKFGFNLEKLSNHYSQLKKLLKVDPETRSYDILTKTHQKIPTIPNMAKVWTTLGNGMNDPIFVLHILEAKLGGSH